MTRYWLTPILSYSPLVLGAERMSCMPDAEFESFRQLADRQHPRLLQMFKASLLLSDEEEICGSDLVELDLTQAGNLVFDGEPFHLSHCAEAFLDRLLTRQESKVLLMAMDEQRQASNRMYDVWIKQWLDWLDTGYDIVLLREDGR
ncbi:hypothetical protein ASG89_08895 [Paenibacillus sp. Soil766]|uniref:hypothetical protein n=1 Tax=Paenibacillus sp. Soil766 TaxID=1736404 RepID=UPI00070EB011|nr:hypothetical protein [Paenibacillus sp. Soil766]KRE90402.1 hypothetical protein ASG89_08895 [Paenibacillus sp. Soil766]